MLWEKKVAELTDTTEAHAQRQMVLDANWITLYSIQG